MKEVVKYCLYKGTCLLSLTVAFWVIAMNLYASNTSLYGQVIHYETKEWASGPIIDLISQSTLTCPTDYELLQGLFYGTETYCPTLGGGYALKKCSKKSKSITVRGLS